MRSKKYLIIIRVIILSGALFTSCKKEKASEPPTPYGTFGLHIHTSVNDVELDSGAVATDASGRKIKLNIAQFYFSNVILKKADGSEIKLNKISLKTIGEETFVLGQVPAGNYTGMSFQVGLDNSTNQTMPSAHPASSVLCAHDPAMWFGSTAQGYMFMNVQGYVDTTSALNGSADQPFSVQLGTASMLKTVNMPSRSYSIVANQTYYIHTMADYGMLLEGVNLKATNTITPFSSSIIAAQIADHVPDIFVFE